MEQVRPDTADLVQVREGVSLGVRIAVSDDEGEGEDGRVILRRATRIADFDDAIHDTKTVRLDATHEGVVVFLHEMTFRDVVSAAFRAEDEETVKAHPVIHFPRIATRGIADLRRTRNRLRLRRGATIEKLCVVDSHDDSFASVDELKN